MKRKIFNSIFIVSVALIILITAITTTTFYNSYCSSQMNHLKEESQLVVRGVELNSQSYLESLDLDNYRITWIKEDGTVIYDTSNDKDSLSNHLEREEVQEALINGFGDAKRYSSTILKESIYVAYRISDGTIVRLSCVQNSVWYLIVSSLYPLYFIAFVSLIIAIVLAITLSNKIINPLNSLDLDNIESNKTYKEIDPLIKKISKQKEQLLSDKSEIEKASLIRQEFTANVSHEMKTPLHVIAGYSELMKEGLVSEENIKEFSKKIFHESYRMTKLVDDILELSKLDSGDLKNSKKTISLDFITKNVIDSLSSVANEKNITINANIDKINIYGVNDVIYSLVYNLIDNAIKYNVDGGSVDITVSKELDIPILIVSDTGIGIPNDQLDRIFERFYRVDKSHSRDIGGTGLGLSIVKHAVIVHNAKISVNSEINKGTTFKVKF